jgi:hypothetical protein
VEVSWQDCEGKAVAMLAVSLLFGWLWSVEFKFPFGERRGDLVCGVEVGVDVLGSAMAGQLRSAWRDCAVSIDNQVVGGDRHCLFERGRLSKDTGGVDLIKGVQIEGAVRQQEANTRSSDTSVECRWPMPSSVPSLNPRVTLTGPVSTGTGDSAGVGRAVRSSHSIALVARYTRTVPGGSRSRRSAKDGGAKAGVSRTGSGWRAHVKRSCIRVIH